MAYLAYRLRRHWFEPYPVNAIFAVDVSNAAVERVGRQHEDEVSSVADASQKIIMKLAGTKFLNVEEHGQTAQLQVNFQQTAHTHAANNNRKAPARGRTGHFSTKKLLTNDQQ